MTDAATPTTSTVRRWTARSRRPLTAFTTVRRPDRFSRELVSAHVEFGSRVATQTLTPTLTTSCTRCARSPAGRGRATAATDARCSRSSAAPSTRPSSTPSAATFESGRGRGGHHRHRRSGRREVPRASSRRSSTAARAARASSTTCSGESDEHLAAMQGSPKFQAIARRFAGLTEFEPHQCEVVHLALASCGRQQSRRRYRLPWWLLRKDERRRDSAEAAAPVTVAGEVSERRLSDRRGRCGVPPELEEVVSGVREPPFRPCCRPAAA